MSKDVKNNNEESTWKTFITYNKRKIHVSNLYPLYLSILFFSIFLFILLSPPRVFNDASLPSPLIKDEMSIKVTKSKRAHETIINLSATDTLSIPNYHFNLIANISTNDNVRENAVSTTNRISELITKLISDYPVKIKTISMNTQFIHHSSSIFISQLAQQQRPSVEIKKGQWRSSMAFSINGSSKNIDINKLISGIQNSGADVNTISWSIDKSLIKNGKKELVARLSKELKSKADDIAKQIGGKFIYFKSLQFSDGNQYIMPMMGLAKKMSAETITSDVSVEGGNSNVSLSVSGMAVIETIVKN